MVLSEQALTVIAVATAATVALLTVVVVGLAARLRRHARTWAAAMGGKHSADIFAALEGHSSDIAALRRDLKTVHGNCEHLRDLFRGTVSRVGVVRYDAFDDMGGALSFSAALLDERGDGVVLSAINGRTEARTYAKAVSAGRSRHHLSPEEEAAIASAMNGDEEGVSPPRRRRRAIF